MSRAYPSYEYSGAEWLGPIPKHWNAVRLKRLFEIVKRIAGTEGYDVLSVTQGGLRIKDLNADKGQFAVDYSGYQIVEPGDFVMNHMDLLTGFADVSPRIGVTSPDYRVFRFREPQNHHPAFFNYLLQNCYRRRIFYAFGKGAAQLGRWRLPTTEFNHFLAPAPPLTEQVAIASFLNRETGKIDALVEKQQRLIELVKEKRQAVISHAAIKGLDPNVPMKPSGAGWLGDIPNHWEISRIKHECINVVDCLHTTPTYEGELRYPAIRTTDVDVGRLDLKKARLVSEEIYKERTVRLRPEAGDIVYSREGRIGIAALVPLGAQVCLGQRMMMFRVHPRHCSEYFMWTLNSQPIYQQVLMRNQKTTSPHINIGEIINFHIPVPPSDEQKKIADWLHDETLRYDALVSNAVTAVGLLHEHRSALISAAVTGKIDVRDEVPQVTEAAE